MRIRILSPLALSLALLGQVQAGADPAAARIAQHSAHTHIVRDTWGIAHVYGRSDADAVFGAIYAQAEDDFGRIERNYLTNLGWLAQAEGGAALYSDLRQRLFVDPEDLKRRYGSAPGWLRELMVAWADGLNRFLATHPAVHAKVIRHFEPWMALSFTEGSIGGDIESVDLAALEQFYDPQHANPRPVAALEPQLPEPFPGGSNGFAISPARSLSGHALLWINPHTSYYFRSELQMSSEQGLNAYGATTWGQFFIYQGFNARNGWMHTSNGGDAIDEYAETVVARPDGRHYQYGRVLRPLRRSVVSIAVKTGSGVTRREFTVYHSHHGPIVRAEGDRWIAVKLFEDPVHALMQSYLRTKTRNYAQFLATQEMRTDTSNNTVYADADGTIAYFHGNFIPQRDPKFDFTHPVDGSDPATEWQAAHAVGDTITLLNPRSGWLMNTNNWPFSAAGESSPKQADYPRYMWTRGENARGLHAVEMLRDLKGVSLDGLIAAGYDPHLTAFDTLLPPLLRAFEALPPGDARRAALAAPVAQLKGWDRRTGADSQATTLAIFWGQSLLDHNAAAARAAEQPVIDYIGEHLDDVARLDALAAAVERLQRDFGTWQIAWGQVNRFQRLTDDIVQPFDDAKPSLPVGFAPAKWGALASFDSTSPRSTRKIYGSVGNSFIAAVEFGPRLQAKALMSGGASGDPQSRHFTDQAEMFSTGAFRDVLFYPEDVQAHAERSYSP
jgi:acyl-homoserine-lactone acylase